jgi:phosphatidylinositol dimannoside acyltransferase
MKNRGQIGYSLLSALARVLPRRICYLIGETLGAAHFLLAPARRRNLYANLEVVCGQPLGRRRFRLGLEVMVNFARGAVDTFLIPHMDEAYLSSHVAMVDKADLPSLLAAGRGVIVATVHLGSWELAGLVLARMGCSITTVAGVQFSPSLSPSVKAMKARYGITVKSAEAGGLAMFRALARGEVVGLHIDGDQYLGGLKTTFFGRPTVMPRGPAALALKTGAPLVPLFALRTSRDAIEVHLEPPVPADSGSEAEVTRRLLAVAENYIRQNPEQWCMFRPIWGQSA